MRLLFSAGSLIFAFVGGAHACAICFSLVVITPGQKLDSADQAVLAIPSVNPSGFRIVATVKGDVTVDEVIEQSDLIMPSGESQRSDGKPLLLVRNDLSDNWTFIGTIGQDYAGWLRQLAATKHDADSRFTKLWPSKITAWSPLSEAEWRERLAIVAPHLESIEPLAAEIAYGEVVRSPYRVMRTLGPQLDAAKIRTWIDDPKQSSRLPLYTLLLGIVGDQDDAAEFETLIDQALEAKDATNLSAMLAADLELRGPSRLNWIHTTFFADRRRTLPEIDAALLALSVHGEADGAVPRQKVIDAYRAFIEARKPMAGFVATDLANWEAWDATADYVEIIRSKAVKDPAGQFAILSYLKISPLTAGLAALPAAE